MPCQFFVYCRQRVILIEWYRILFDRGYENMLEC